jgi:hypothetical protein
MVAAVVVNDTFPEIAAPPGWTQVRRDENRSAVRQDIYYKVAGPADPATFTWSINSSGRLLAGTIASYSGVDTTRPIDDHAATVDMTGGKALTTPSVTVSSPGAMLLSLVSVRADGSITPPAGMTERSETAAGVATKGVTSEWSDDVATVRGPTGKRIATSSVSGRYVAALLALRPAP